MQHQLDLTQGRLRVHERGHGPVLVFLHGLLVDHELWEEVVDRLAPAHRCVALDLPLGAHRDAMRPDADMSPRGLARLVAEALAALELEDVTLVANDTGGAIAQLTAADHPERLAALVLTDCDAYENFLPPVLRPLQWLARVPALAGPMLRAGRFGPVRTALTAPVNKRRDAERGRRWVQPLVDDAGVRRDVIKFLAAIDGSETVAAAQRLRCFDHPALIIWSREDRIFPVCHAHRLAADLPDARVELVDDSGAFVPLDQPARCVELIEAFVSQRARAQATGAGSA